MSFLLDGRIQSYRSLARLRDGLPTMVVFVDLDDEDMEPLHVLEARRLATAAAVATDALEASSRELEHMLEKPAIAPAPLVTPALVSEPTPTFQSAATEAFGCYP